MKSDEKIEYAQKIINIQENMKDIEGWETLANLHKILQKQFETDDKINFPLNYDTFYKQLKGKGSKKYMKKYYEYLWSREDVKEYYSNLKAQSNNKFRQIIITLFLIVLMSYLSIFLIQDNTFDKIKQTQTTEYKQCMKKCLSEQTSIPKN